MPAIKLIRRLCRQQLLNELYKEFRSTGSTLSLKFDFAPANGNICISPYPLIRRVVIFRIYLQGARIARESEETWKDEERDGGGVNVATKGRKGVPRSWQSLVLIGEIRNASDAEDISLFSFLPFRATSVILNPREIYGIHPASPSPAERKIRLMILDTVKYHFHGDISPLSTCGSINPD